MLEEKERLTALEQQLAEANTQVEHTRATLPVDLLTLIDQIEDQKATYEQLKLQLRCGLAIINAPRVFSLVVVALSAASFMICTFRNIR